MRCHIFSKFLVLSVACFTTSFSGDASDKTSGNILDHAYFVVIDQPENLDLKVNTMNALENALTAHGVKQPIINSLWPFPEETDLRSWGDLREKTHGGWTYFPILRSMVEMGKALDRRIDWYIFIHESGRINAGNLEKMLKDQDPNKELYFGKALRDKEHTIIHHFQSDLEFEYPDLSAGLILSRGLAEDLASFFRFHKLNIRAWPEDFTIDMAFEMAQAIYYRHVDDSDGTPVSMTHSDLMCSREGNGCASWNIQHSDRGRECKTELQSTEGILASLKRVSIAVKTCKKYHKSRLPVVQKTWARAAPNIKFVSEVASKKYGTSTVGDVTKNTERGHCQKTRAIIQDFHERADAEDLHWLVITDDDTILSVAKLAKLLNCYDPSNPIILGQRYGFKVNRGFQGYDYPTGGAGMVFSRVAVSQIVGGGKSCECGQPDSPDDMEIGVWATHLGLSITHSDQMHQARPEDYSEALLADQDPISFHKHWNTDPVKMYEKWFSQADKDLIKLLDKPIFKEHVAKDEL